MERAGRDRFRKQGLEPGFDHRTVTGGDCRDLHFVRIDSPDLVTVRGQAGGGDGTDISKPEDGDFHAVGRRGSAGGAWCDGVMHKMSRAASLKYTSAAISWPRSCHGGRRRRHPLTFGQEAWRRRPFEGFGGITGRASSDHPARRAIATAASWEFTPSLSKMALICDRTVEIDTKAAFAMSSAQLPSMSSDSTNLFALGQPGEQLEAGAPSPRVRRVSRRRDRCSRDSVGRAATRQPSNGLEQLVKRFILADDGRRAGSKPRGGSVTVPGVIDDADLAPRSLRAFDDGRSGFDVERPEVDEYQVRLPLQLPVNLLGARCGVYGGQSVRFQRSSQRTCEEIAPGDQHASGLHQGVRRTVVGTSHAMISAERPDHLGEQGHILLVPDIPSRAMTDIVIARQTRSALAQYLCDRANSVRASSQCPTPILQKGDAPYRHSACPSDSTELKARRHSPCPTCPRYR